MCSGHLEPPLHKFVKNYWLSTRQIRTYFLPFPIMAFCQLESSCRCTSMQSIVQQIGERRVQIFSCIGVRELRLHFRFEGEIADLQGLTTVWIRFARHCLRISVLPAEWILQHISNRTCSKGISDRSCHSAWDIEQLVEQARNVPIKHACFGKIRCKRISIRVTSTNESKPLSKCSSSW